MAAIGRLESSREAILEILRRRDGVSVDELAQSLGLAGATVRRHLDVLMRDGYVAASQVRGGMGRPRYAFSLTESGAELFPHHYVRLTRRLIEEIVALDPSETAGRNGSQLADLIFEKMSERLAREYGPRVDGATVRERVRTVAALLADEGLDFEVELGERTVRLLGRGCPCRRLDGRRENGLREACDHDRRLIERLVGAPVARLRPDQLPHDFWCGYELEG